MPLGQRLVIKGLKEKFRSPFLMLCIHGTLLLSHQDLCQALESLTSTVAGLSASAHKVSNRDSSVQEAAALQQNYECLLRQTKERQTVLEKLLAHWQR